MASGPPPSPAKLAGAVLLLLGAVAVLAHNLLGAGEDDEPRTVFAGSVPARGAGAPAAASAAAEVVPPAAAAPAAGLQQAMQAPASAAAAPAGNGSAPRMDLTALFDRLLDRERGVGLVDPATVAPPPELTRPRVEEPSRPLASYELRGLLRTPRGGRALVDGHPLQVGDFLPGSRFRLRAIGSDRILVDVPGQQAPGVLRLQAPSSTVTLPAPAVAPAPAAAAPGVHGGLPATGGPP